MEEMDKGLHGHKHVLSQSLESIIAVFDKLGFSVVEGPEIETEHYNFDVLNIPANHPARDMWDTLWLKLPRSERGSSPDPAKRDLGQNKLLRTHTSPVQARFMETHKPPLAIIVPGKVFRHEATDATHEAQFYQLEGLMVGKDVTLGMMTGVVRRFFKEFFGSDVKTRIRPSYFPFTEPSVEVDMSCFKCGGEKDSCSVCKGTGWIEIMGAGMVHPNVLNKVGINPRYFQGFAFGCGVDRLVMLKYGIDDVRTLYSGDLRLVNQF